MKPILFLYRTLIALTSLLGTIASGHAQFHLIKDTSNLINKDFNFNYIREFTTLVSGITNSGTIDSLPMGQKLQTTTYLDGLARPIQKISHETATPDPSQQNNLWGDVIQFIKYDALGRQPIQYLPYTSTTESGRYKSAPLTEQPAYYTNVYNENSAYNLSTYDNSPLNRVVNVKSSGTSWANSRGKSVTYGLNDSTDNVQVFNIGYSPGDIPYSSGVYPTRSLFKNTQSDERGKQVIEYVNVAGQLILKKIQLDDDPSPAHLGWICTYSIYDDFGLLRYRIQPEGVKYLDANGWSFSGVNGQQVLNEFCFRYEFDEKGRNTLKKAPGAKELLMVYDRRDRVVFMQDGNQRVKSPREWTANVYDELDRLTLTTIYRTGKSASNLPPDITDDLNDASKSILIKYNFYDDYNFSDVKSFQPDFDNSAAYITGDPIVKTSRTISMITGTKVRILGMDKFLTTTIYYDEKGRPIQTIADNIKSGQDFTTHQYQFDGRLLSINTKHSTANTGYSSYSILTKNLFDKIGRITGIRKKYGTNDFKTIATYDFDDMGRLKTKHLDPGFTGSGKNELESLAYTYNIHNEITGINKDYALKTPGKYNKWGNFFGLYLGFDNKDQIFGTAQLDGHVTGALWTTQGDDAQRKYDFSYDNAGRLTSALFNERQKSGDNWSNAKMDFSVSGSKGKITYDLNGNLLTMLQKGVVPGSQTAVNIDDLYYAYANLSNKLMRVTDNCKLDEANGKAGDFADGGNTNSDDYVYDDNGNLVIDLNKKADGIRYNFLDKPEEVHITGKGTIRFIYDANGNKLQKIFTPEGSSTATTTTYINEFIYEGDSLQYINFEEGRIRVVQAVNQNNGFDLLAIDGNMDLRGGKRGAYDFFIRDYQGNVRVLVTEETHLGSNSCTMEIQRAANEEPIFGQVDANGKPTAENEVSARFPSASIPGKGIGEGWQNSNIGNYVSRIGNLAGKKVGPNTLLKVMAGDQVSATTIYYYQEAVINNNSGSSFLANLLVSLGQAISGSSITSGILKSTASGITAQLNTSVPFAAFTDPDAAKTSVDNPKACLSVLFFDERFNFVSEGSASVQVSQAGDGAPALVLANIKAPKNGYAYVYVSNASDEMVYFDNMQVTNNHGQIVEENHYYPFGLRIASLSSRKMADPNEGRTGNKHLYNDKELIDDAGLNWYDYGFRNYDPQTGRFPQLDPLTDDYPFLTPYQYASNDPITNIDLDGLEGVISTTAGTAKVLAPVTVIGRMPGSVASASNAVLNAGVRVGLDGVNMLTSQSISQAEFRNRQATVTGISERQMRGYNWWHDAKELDFTGRISILDGFINPVYRTLQQISAKATGQSIIRNLDGTRAGYSSSRSQSDVKQRVFDFVQTGSVFIGPAYGGTRATAAAVDGGETFFESASYSSKVARQMGKADDIFNAFPKSVDGFATKFGQWSTKVGADGKTYQWLEMGGSYGGRMGKFEYIKDANGVINHRFFNVPRVP
ncbi:MAG: DUF6443 domain-containing protein [Chitinophagaceae bacterium]